MCCVRVNEQMLLIDAVKDLLNHVCSEAQKTTVNDAANYFTTQIRQPRDQAVVTAAAAGDNYSAEQERTINVSERMIQNIAENTLTADICSDGQNTSTKDFVGEASCRDVKDAEVAASGDGDSRSVDDTVKAHGCWKLLIRVRDRRKDVKHRYVHFCHISQAELMANITCCGFCREVFTSSHLSHHIRVISWIL